MAGVLSQIILLLRRSPLWGILLIGLILRLMGIESRSLQYDDTFSIFLAGRSLTEVLSGTAADTMPPLYYFLLHFWMLISREVWFIRLLSVLLSLGIIALLYLSISRLFNRTAAGWAALLAAISPLQIYHAQDVRMYALLVLCQLGYLYCFIRLHFGHEERGNLRWDWLGLILCGVLAMYSHNLAIFAIIVPNFYLLIKREWKKLVRLIAAQLVIGLLALPWLLLIPGQIAKVQKAWTLPQPGVIEVLQTIIMFTASLPLPVILLGVIAVLSLQILVMVGLESWRERRSLPGILFLVCLLLLPPALLYAASYMMKPVFVTRGFLISSLAYYGLAGVVICQSWSRKVGMGIAGAFVLSAVLSLPSFYTFEDFPRSPYKEAAAYLQTVVTPGTQVVHENKLSYFSAHYYAPELPQVFVADIPGSANDTFEPESQQAMQIFPQPDLASAVGESSEVYYVFFSQTLAEYQAIGLEEHPGIGWLDDHYRQVDQTAFNDLLIYHYQR